MKNIVANNLITELKEISSIKTQMIFYLSALITLIDIFLVFYYTNVTKQYTDFMINSVPVMILITIMLTLLSLMWDKYTYGLIQKKISKCFSESQNKIRESFVPGFENCKRQYELLMFPIINKAWNGEVITFDEYSLFKAGMVSSHLCDYYSKDDIMRIKEQFYKNAYTEVHKK